MLLSITFILFLFTLSLLAKLRANGLVYGLDFGLFHPDGSLYTFRTLTWLGYTQDEAGIKVSEWYANHAVKANQIDPQSLHFEISPHWEIYQLRLLYPALSMPFVFLMGIPGMLVIPSLSMLTLLISTYFIARNLGSPSLGIFFAAFFSFSLTINRWMYINTADSLLVALTCLAVLIIMRDRLTTKLFLCLIFLVILASLTRFSLFIWIAVGLFLAIKKHYAKAIIMTAVAFVSFLPHLLVDYAPAVLASQSQLSLPEKVLQFPYSLIRVGFYEVAQLAVLDRFLLGFILIAILFAAFNHISDSARLFFVVLASLWLTGAINGVIGVNFRYQLPILPFAVWVLVEHRDRLSQGFSKSRLPKLR